MTPFNINVYNESEFNHSQYTVVTVVEKKPSNYATASVAFPYRTRIEILRELKGKDFTIFFSEKTGSYEECMAHLSTIKPEVDRIVNELYGEQILLEERLKNLSNYIRTI